MSTNDEERWEERRRQPTWMPSVYRYLALGLILPAFVVVGMVIGYSYGQQTSEWQAALFAAVGSMAGLAVSTVIIVRIGLAWDKRIRNSMNGSRHKRRKRTQKRIS